MTPHLSALISRLESVRGSGVRYQAKCPAHADKTASLLVTGKPDGKITLHCFGGCTVQSVLSSLGMTFADLFYPRDPSKPYVRPAPLARRTMDAQAYLMLFRTAVDWSCEHAHSGIVWRYTGRNDKPRDAVIRKAPQWAIEALQRCAG